MVRENSSKFSPKLRSVFIILLVVFGQCIITPQLSVQALLEETNNGDTLLNENNGGFEGYNLYVVERHDSVDSSYNNRTIIISDLQNRIYFTKEIYYEGALANYAAEFINSTTILYGDYTGAMLWNIETNVTESLNFNGHHDYEKNYANDTYFALLKTVSKTCPNGCNLVLTGAGPIISYSISFHLLNVA